MFRAFIKKHKTTPRRAVYPGRKEPTMTEREIERILAEESDEAKAWEAIEEYLKGGGLSGETE
jgi:hypothetical protein